MAPIIREGEGHFWGRTSGFFWEVIQNGKRGPNHRRDLTEGRKVNEGKAQWDKASGAMPSLLLAVPLRDGYGHGAGRAVAGGIGALDG